MKFQKGQSGNPGGRPKKKLVDRHLSDLLEERDGKRARQIALMLLDKARRGNLKAAEMIMERTEGKPVQKTQFEGSFSVGLFLTDAERERRIDELIAKRGAPKQLPAKTNAERANAA